MKKCQMLVLLMGLAVIPLFASGPGVIELDYFPPPGGKITLHENYPIYYMWDPGDLAVPPTHFKLELFKGGTTPANFVGLIAQNIPLGKTGFNQTAGGSPDNGGIYFWHAGTLIGGQAPAGSGYCVRAVTMDGQITSHCYSFNLEEPPPPNNNIIKGKRFILMQRVSGCPMCGIFDLNGLLAKLGNPVNMVGDLVILRNGRQLGKLAKLGQGGMLLNRAPKLQFAAADFALIGKENQSFEVAIVGARGIILQRQPISLKMK